MAAAYHPAGRKRWIVARGGHARGETGQDWRSGRHGGQVLVAVGRAAQFHADISQPAGAIRTTWVQKK